MKEFSKFVGMDVHKATIAVSVAEANGGEIRYLGEIANTSEAITKLVRQLRKGDAQLSFCYEAGPCGYGFIGNSLGNDVILDPGARQLPRRIGCHAVPSPRISG